MKIISLIPSFNPNNEFVSKVIEELKKFSNIILFTTENHTLNVDETLYFDKSICGELAYKPREWVLNNIDKEWEYVLYNEDDILIPQESVKNVIDLYNTLPSPFIPGFIRYEFDDRDNTKRYIDMNPVHGVHRGQYGTIKQKFDNVWEPCNLHSGNWLFSKQYVKNMIDNKLWETYFKQYGFQYGSCGRLESAASVPYFFCTKVFPYDVEKVECLHLPKKYIYLDVNPTKEDLI